MKKSILFIACIISTHFLSCMEMPSHVAKIIVTQDKIYNREHSYNADVTVAGIREQIRLAPDSLSDPGAVGDVYKSKKNTVKIKNEIFEKYFDRTYKGWNEPLSIKVEGTIFDIQNPWKCVETKKIDGHLLLVTEPIVLTGTKVYKYKYNPTRRLSENRFTDPEFYDDQAIGEAQKDLDLCYKNIFEKVCQLCTANYIIKSIAFPPLSESLSKDKSIPVAVASVITFLKDSRDKKTCDVIEFVVGQQDDFNLYKNILDNQKELTKEEKTDYNLQKSILNPVELTYLFTKNDSKK